MIARACKDHGYPGGSRWIYRDCYRSMLDAAPSAPDIAITEREECTSARTLLSHELVSADASERQIRAEFERWARDEFYAGMACASDTWDEHRGMYNDAAHHMAFTAWQAAQACNKKGIK